jgi:hypothetical protein
VAADVVPAGSIFSNSATLARSCWSSDSNCSTLRSSTCSVCESGSGRGCATESTSDCPCSKTTLIQNTKASGRENLKPRNKKESCQRTAWTRITASMEIMIRTVDLEWATCGDPTGYRGGFGVRGLNSIADRGAVGRACWLKCITTSARTLHRQSGVLDVGEFLLGLHPKVKDYSSNQILLRMSENISLGYVDSCSHSKYVLPILSGKILEASKNPMALS